jgi:hypothetical protein
LLNIPDDAFDVSTTGWNKWEEESVSVARWAADPALSRMLRDDFDPFHTGRHHGGARHPLVYLCSKYIVDCTAAANDPSCREAAAALLPFLRDAVAGDPNLESGASLVYALASLANSMS